MQSLSLHVFSQIQFRCAYEAKAQENKSNYAHEHFDLKSEKVEAEKDQKSFAEIAL
jgi:hypothetical protein